MNTDDLRLVAQLLCALVASLAVIALGVCAWLALRPVDPNEQRRRERAAFARINHRVRQEQQ